MRMLRFKEMLCDSQTVRARAGFAFQAVWLQGRAYYIECSKNMRKNFRVVESFKIGHAVKDEHALNP